MSLTIVILSWKRTQNLPKILESIKLNTIQPDKVFVFNNNLDIQLTSLNAVTINSGENFGCQMRHAFALGINSTHFMFIDDDLMLKPTTIASFVNWGNKYPEAILGYWGRKVGHDKSPYHDASEVNFSVVEPTEIDIVLGRLHYCRKDKLSLPFYYKFFTKEDDIALSLANKKAGFKNYVIPGTGTIDLPGYQQGICNRDNHWDIRDQAVRDCL